MTNAPTPRRIDARSVIVDLTPRIACVCSDLPGHPDTYMIEKVKCGVCGRIVYVAEGCAYGR
jgi:hypothetical protein